MDQLLVPHQQAEHVIVGLQPVSAAVGQQLVSAAASRAAHQGDQPSTSSQQPAAAGRGPQRSQQPSTAVMAPPPPPAHLLVLGRQLQGLRLQGPAQVQADPSTLQGTGTSREGVGRLYPRLHPACQFGVASLCREGCAWRSPPAAAGQLQGQAGRQEELPRRPLTALLPPPHPAPSR